MVNTELLEAKISECGFTKKFLAAKIGISLSNLILKVSGKREFRASEIGMLIKILKISTLSEVRAIFFAEKVA